MGVLKRWTGGFGKTILTAIALPLLISGCGTASDIAAIQATVQCTEAMEELVTALDTNTAARDAGEDINESEVRSAEKAMESLCSNP